ncbi:MAG: glycosyltransferase family 4 protein [Ferruginibacter sp.]
MKVALVTNNLYPEALGGTELYCYQLANALIGNGNEAYWFVPNLNKNFTATEERGNGIKIVKFALFDKHGASPLTFITASFIAEMKARDIRVAHFHEFGGPEGISKELLAETKKAGIATVVTLHLVSYACQTGLLHYGGVVPCNGKIIPNRCSSCCFFSNKTSSASLNLALTNVFSGLFKLKPVQSIPRIKRFMNGVNMKATFIASVRENADVIVTLTKWFRDVLLINGFDEKKIKYIEQVSPEFDSSKYGTSASLRKNYVFIGRINKEKGVDLLLSLSAKLKKELPGVLIDMYGPYQPAKILPHTIVDDLEDYDNVRYLGSLPPDEVLPVMSKYKAVILPSRVAEMAPLIIMEANKLKMPVIASDVPGSAELVKQTECGVIFKYSSAEDLFKKIIEVENNVHEFAFKQPAENSFHHTAGKYEAIYTACLDQYEGAKKLN